MAPCGCGTWSVASRCASLQGYVASLFDMDWSPDGTRLASAGSETRVSIWEVEHATPPSVLRGHRGVVYAVAMESGWEGFWRVADWDGAVRVWDTSHGSRVGGSLRDPDHVDIPLLGRGLESGWEVSGQCNLSAWRAGVGDDDAQPPWAGLQQLPTWIRHLAWSPDGTRLVGGSDDGQVYVWDGSDGTLLQRLTGHHGVVTSVVWSPDGTGG